MDVRYATREMKEIGHDLHVLPPLRFSFFHLIFFYDLRFAFIAFTCILRTGYYMFSYRLP